MKSYLKLSAMMYMFSFDNFSFQLLYVEFENATVLFIEMIQLNLIIERWLGKRRMIFR